MPVATVTSKQLSKYGYFNNILNFKKQNSQYTSPKWAKKYKRY